MMHLTKNITMVEARQLLEVVSPLAKGCAFTKSEFLQIMTVCHKCVNRLEDAEREREAQT